MKKKLLSLIFAICLILPCTFTLSACGENPPPNEPVTLAGKTIVVDSCGDITWSEIAISNMHFNGEKQFSINLTLTQFVERYWDTEVVSDIVGNNYSSLAQAKQAIIDVVKARIATYSPKITISADETTALVEYDYPGCIEPVKNCVVQRMDSQSNQACYELYYGGNPIGTINYMNGAIDCYTTSDALFIYYVHFNLATYTSISMDLVAEDGSGDTYPLTLSQSNELCIYTEVQQKYKIEIKQ